MFVRETHSAGGEVNATRELFRKTSHFFARFPILWVPVLLADLLRTLIGTFVPQLTRGALLAAAPKSALGGIAALPKPATIAAISSGIGFAATALGLLLYLYALGIVARALVKSTQHPSWRPTLNFEFPRGIWPAWLQVCGLAALFALLSAIVISWIVRSGLKGGAFQFCVFAVIIPLIAVLLYPAMLVLRRYVLKVQTGVAYEAWPRLPYYLLVFAAVLCSNLAGTAIGVRHAAECGRAEHPAGLWLSAAANTGIGGDCLSVRVRDDGALPKRLSRERRSRRR